MRADVGAAVAADLGLVAHAAQRHAHELAAGGAGHALAQRGLAHARRAHQAQDGRLDLVDALLHREVFEDAVLDLVQAVVVFVEHVLGIGQVVLDLGLLAPGQVDQGVDVVAHHGGFGRHGRHQLELLQLALGLLARFLGHARGLDLLLEFLEVGAFFAVAQFLLDGLDLLVQVVLALALLHLPLDAAADALFHLQDVDLVLQQFEQLLQPLGDENRSSTACLASSLSGRCAAMVSARRPGVVDAGDAGQDLGRDLLVELDVLVELLRHGTAQRLDLGRGSAPGGTGTPRRRSTRPVSVMRVLARCTPSTSTFTVPSGSLSICRMLDTQPTSNMSSALGSSLPAAFCATSMICRPAPSPLRAP
jgi:hypothetical protein